MSNPAYQRCGDDVREMETLLREQFHPELDAAKVRIDLLFAYPTIDEDTGEVIKNAIMHQGYKATGLAKIIGPKERALGLGDGCILLDANAWEAMLTNERMALLDHELEHFQIKKDKYGIFQFDDMNRAKLKMKKHDHQMGWFVDIARRWGKDSGEVQFAAQVMEEAGQFYWPELAGKLSI